MESVLPRAASGTRRMLVATGAGVAALVAMGGRALAQQGPAGQGAGKSSQLHGMVVSVNSGAKSFVLRAKSGTVTVQLAPPPTPRARPTGGAGQGGKPGGSGGSGAPAGAGGQGTKPGASGGSQMGQRPSKPAPPARAQKPKPQETSIDSLKAGDRVVVVGSTGANGTFLARHIHLLPPLEQNKVTHVVGTVQSFDGSALVVQKSDGTTQTVKVSADTTFKPEGKTAAALAAGVKVTVVARGGNATSISVKA